MIMKYHRSKTVPNTFFAFYNIFDELKQHQILIKYKKQKQRKKKAKKFKEDIALYSYRNITMKYSSFAT